MPTKDRTMTVSSITTGCLLSQIVTLLTFRIMRRIIRSERMRARLKTEIKKMTSRQILAKKMQKTLSTTRSLSKLT